MKVRLPRAFRYTASPAVSLLIFSLILLIAGCGGSTKQTSPTGPPPSATPTVTINSNPASVPAGSTSTLTVAATNATSVTITGSDSTTYKMPVAGGTQAVSPAATTTYTVTAGNGSQNATAKTTVTVVPAAPPPAPTVSVAASPATIQAGSSSTLTITVANATSVIVAGTDGSSYTMQPTGGTQAVTPAVTTTYTVTASGAGGQAMASAIVTVTQPTTPAVTLAANPNSIASGNSSILTVTATNVTAVTITGTDGSSYPIAVTNGSVINGTQSVTPASTTTYTATGTGAAGTTPATATATVTITAPGSVKSIDHVIFMMQENHSFDNYFGMLNQYRQTNGYNKGDDGNEYDVDGLYNDYAGVVQDKRNGQTYAAEINPAEIISNNDGQGTAHTLFPFKSSCIDDMSSAWVESFGDVSLGNFLTTRPIQMNGFVSNAEGFANSKCPTGNEPDCSAFTDKTGDRAMGYYDEGTLNYYYYMASQFALSDRWFSPVASKSIPNRIATFTGGTTQGLTRDPGGDDGLNQLSINNIFQELDQSNVSWKIYYSADNGQCDPEDCKQTQSGSQLLPATTFSYLTYSYKYIYTNAAAPNPAGCVAPASPSSAIGDTSNSFCIDLNKIAPISDPTYGYFADLKNGTLPSFSFIESGSGINDEHPGSGQSILAGQGAVASIINALMASTSWKDSAFFFAYDEGGGPYDHVPPVPNHTNDLTDAAAVASYPTDVSTISVAPDTYSPCVPAAPGDLHCDLQGGQPGSGSGDAAAPPPNGQGFGAQVGFRVPDFVISPFSRKHYVSHVPMDHTAIIRFVEDRFIGNSQYLTKRDAAQPNLLDFFDFTNVPWATPPTPPAPIPIGSTCQPSAFH